MDELTAAQREAVEGINSYGVTIDWFVGSTRDDGSRELIAMGRTDEESFAWSVVVHEDGRVATSEAAVGDWSPGITI